VDGDEAAQKALRFAIYHMNSAANPDDEHVSIGARGLTGDGYSGHVFWDTDIFLLPFYIFTWPEAARAMLMYRYHTLPPARAKAARLGFRGALYAWESTDTGEETTPTFVIGPDGAIVPVRCGTDEQHISADVAYAVWQYWQATGDAKFLLDAGAEILLETARFWASRVVLEADERYHIRGVIGPDEYHEDVDDNAYTNVMAQWNLERGVEVAALLERRWPEHWTSIADRLQLDPDETAEWQTLASRLFTSVDPATGLLEQFAGFFDLEPVDIAAYEPRSAPLDLLLGHERTERSQVIKQADVVMLLAMLEDRFPEGVRRANYFYYEQRCGHGSSLSPGVHALVAARLGDMTRAERYFRETAAIDLDDTMGNASQGIHIGALGGLWQAVVFGFGGLSVEPKGLRAAPRLPVHWSELRFPFRWRGRVVRFVIQRDPALITATLERGRSLRLTVGTAQLKLQRGESLTTAYDQTDGLVGR
jgi:trehalose/maltose hydrolase-like predicted phosphorylase